MGQLGDIAKARSPWFKLKAGEKASAVYKGFKLIPNTYDPSKPDNYRFVLEIDGATKYWDTGSNGVAMMMDAVGEGEIIEIQNNADPNDLKAKPKWMVVRMVEMAEEKKKK